MTKPTLVEVKVTDKNAIYVNDTRITDRGTKWGVHSVVFAAYLPADDIVSPLLLAGHGKAVKRIDYEPYLSQARPKEPPTCKPSLQVQEPTP